MQSRPDALRKKKKKEQTGDTFTYKSNYISTGKETKLANTTPNDARNTLRVHTVPTVQTGRGLALQIKHHEQSKTNTNVIKHEPLHRLRVWWQ